MTTTSTSPNYTLHDLDKEATHLSTLSKIASAQSNNFAAYFDHEQAAAATDLSQEGLDSWINDHGSRPGTKWIHFWADQSQRPLIAALAARYGISPRLVGLLCPCSSLPTPPAKSNSAHTPNGHIGTHLTRHRTKNDVESVTSSAELKPLERKGPKPGDISFGDVVNDLWHFHSVDWGEKYVHVGVNVLSVVPGLKHPTNKPAGQRLWTSLILCHDGTVISTLERRQISDDDDVARLANKIAKRHILHIFSQISRLSSMNTQQSNDITGISLRPNPRPVNSTSELDQKECEEYASLLFYYLFDDWMSTFALISRREHPYRENLEKVRQDLETAPDVGVLETLHNIGRQLTVLRLMYQSYATVVTRILRRSYKPTPAAVLQHWQQATNRMHSAHQSETAHDDFASLGGSPLSYRAEPLLRNGTDYSTATTVMNHPTVSSAALARFERLLDRIHLYALSEIDQALAEKESLSFMTFNLLALSESRAVEKLTRSAMVLSKATVIFLPVSLLTAYFSIQVGDIGQRYSLKTYWLSFLVVVLSSLVFLVGFQFATEKIEGQINFLSTHRALWRKGVARLMNRRTRE